MPGDDDHLLSYADGSPRRGRSVALILIGLPQPTGTSPPSRTTRAAEPLTTLARGLVNGCYVRPPSKRSPSTRSRPSSWCRKGPGGESATSLRRRSRLRRKQLRRGYPCSPSAPGVDRVGTDGVW